MGHGHPSGTVHFVDDLASIDFLELWRANGGGWYGKHYITGSRWYIPENMIKFIVFSNHEQWGSVNVVDPKQEVMC